MKIILTIVASLLMFVNLSAISDPVASGKITGIVLEKGVNTGIEYANIVLFKKADSSIVTGLVTDKKGYFKLSQIPYGEYYLTVDFIGYKKIFINDISIKKGNKNINLGKLFLNKAVQEIDEIEVSEEKDAVQYKIDKKIINVSKKPQAAGGTVVDALENTPSIQIDAEGNVSLRGSSNFKVLIDGKPSALSGSDALKTIPASAVDNVELITNPSAKYDPEGTSGIINIIMKKGYSEALNGIINISGGTSWKKSADFTLNYRTKKVNYFISGNYSDRPAYPSTEIYNETTINDTVRYVQQIADRFHNHKSYKFEAGLDYYLNQKNTLTLSGEYGFWGFGLNMDANVNEYTMPVSSDIFLNTVTDMNIGGNYIVGNVTFDHDFSKTDDWVTTFTYSTWGGENYTDVDEQTTNELYTQINGSNRNKTQRNTENFELHLKSDYTKTIGKVGKLEAGIKIDSKNEKGDYSYLNFNNDSQNWIEDLNFSNSMNFVRNIYAAYTTFGSSFKGFQYLIGIRGEYNDRNLEQITTKEEFPVKQFNFFPSVHITRQLPAGQQLQASYSRRVNRPQSWTLNPFPHYSDSYIVQGGNPALLPEFTDSYELNYMKRLRIGFFAIEGYYRQTNDSHQREMNLREDGIVHVNTVNLDKTYAYGVELSGNIRPTKWLSIYASANLYNYTLQGDNIPATTDLSAIKNDFTLSTTFTITRSTRLQLSGFYRSPTLTSQGQRSEMYGANVALSQSFFKRKLSITLRGRDIFQTMKFKFNAESEGLKTDFVFNMESPVIMLSISYRLNNYKKRKKDPDAEPSVGGGGGMM